MSGQAVALLSALHAAGVRVVLGATGDTLELTGKRPSAALLEEVRASKAALLEVLAQAYREAHKLPRATPTPCPPVPPHEGLPDHLARLVSMAKAGKLPRGMAKLAGGLIPDLTIYVLAWAEGWPHDRAHVLRRLEEAWTSVETSGFV